MNTPQYLHEYMEYVGTHSDLKPSDKFEAKATRANELPLFFNSLPTGDVFVYPDFLVFLTTEGGAPGMKLLAKQFAQDMMREAKVYYNLHKWGVHPDSMLTDIAKALYGAYKPDDILAKALSNPNSIYVPLSKVRSANKGRRLDQGNFIQVAVEGFNLMICQQEVKLFERWCN